MFGAEHLGAIGVRVWGLSLRRNWGLGVGIGVLRVCHGRPLGIEQKIPMTKTRMVPVLDDFLATILTSFHFRIFRSDPMLGRFGP